MLAWHCEPELKAQAIERLREHRRLDQITQGVYWEGGRGCNLGCLTHVGDSREVHAAASRMFGLPLKVCHWLEAVFEKLPEDRCADWVVDSASAIPVGADLSLVHHVFFSWLLRESGLLTIVDCNRDAIARVAELHERAASGAAISESDWSAARSVAYSAARSVACSAFSVAESACAAAYSGAYRVDTTAGSAAWIKIADKSLEIFAAAPVQRCDEFETELYCGARRGAPVLV